MSAFPKLKTGAVLQYPAQTALRFSTQLVRFIDGSEQRYRDFASPLRRWTIQLDMLDEGEVQSLSEFFRALSGAAENFSFTDPWDGTTFPSCRLDGDEMTVELLDAMKSKTALVVTENRS